MPGLRDIVIFQSTPPAWGATKVIFNCGTMKRFQSTPPAWGATMFIYSLFQSSLISIHAPRMGSDTSCIPFRRDVYHFNPRPPHGERLSRSFIGDTSSHISIHAPRRGSDFSSFLSASSGPIFQSTPPAWGATRRELIVAAVTEDFNPRPPHGERRPWGTHWTEG